MDKVKAFSSQAHESSSHISALREKAKEKGLDTIENLILHVKTTFDMIENKKEIEGITEEWYRQMVLFATMADFALSAVHCHLGGSVTPEELADTITDLYRRKNADYGDAFARSLDKYGIVAALVRINDKVNRIKSLTAPGREAQVKDESIQDTLLDLASYGIMTVMWIEESDKEKELVEKTSQS